MPLFVSGAKLPRSSRLFVLGFLAIGFLVLTASSGHKEAFDGSSRDNAAAAGCSDGDTTAALVLRGGHGVHPSSGLPALGVDSPSMQLVALALGVDGPRVQLVALAFYGEVPRVLHWELTTLVT